MSDPVTTEPVKTVPTGSKTGKVSLFEIYYPREVEGHRDVIHIASFPEIVYFWPLVLVSFFCAFLQGVGASPVTAGWIFTIVMALNFIVLIQNFDQKQFTILVLVIVALMLGVWIVNLYGFSFFKTFASWLLGFAPAFSTDAYLLIGGLMLIFFIWGLTTPLFDYWKFEQNEFVHFTQPIGRDMSIARIGCTIYKDFPDIFETILTFGGGSLIVRRDNQVLANIRNVPFLGRRMRALEHMLSETRVTVSQESR